MKKLDTVKNLVSSFLANLPIIVQPVSLIISGLRENGIVSSLNQSISHISEDSWRKATKSPQKLTNKSVPEPFFIGKLNNKIKKQSGLTPFYTE